MVCNRCIKVVREEFTKLELQIDTIELGKVILENDLDAVTLPEIENVLTANGFELIDDKRSRIIEQIKSLIIQSIHSQKEKETQFNISYIISSEIGLDYSYISNLFSSVEGITIEKYVINQKIEKVKELLVYDEITLNEISYQLGYSSVQHLSNQFKKITGLTPSHFKKLKEIKRKPLDKV